MTELFSPVCSITTTQRRRFYWAAWWTQPPCAKPFCTPDAAQGGARTRDEALRAAEAAAGQPLRVIDSRWARAHARTVRGLPPFPERAEETATFRPAASVTTPPPSVWARLGVTPHATVDEVKAAFRKRALETHPDRGGDASAFRALHADYSVALERATKRARRPKRRTPP